MILKKSVITSKALWLADKHIGTKRWNIVLL